MKQVLSGLVIAKPADTESKSKREQFFLRLAPLGEEYPIVMRGNNPFENKFLRPFLGQICEFVGEFDGGVFVIERINL